MAPNGAAAVAWTRGQPGRGQRRATRARSRSSRDTSSVVAERRRTPTSPGGDQPQRRRDGRLGPSNGDHPPDRSRRAGPPTARGAALQTLTANDTGSGCPPKSRWTRPAAQPRSGPRTRARSASPSAASRPTSPARRSAARARLRDRRLESPTRRSRSTGQHRRGVWSANDQPDFVMQAATRPSGGSFGSLSHALRPGRARSRPRSAMDGSGNAGVVWQGFSGSVSAIQAAFRHGATATSTRPTTSTSLDRQLVHQQRAEPRVRRRRQRSHDWVRGTSTARPRHVQAPRSGPRRRRPEAQRLQRPGLRHRRQPRSASPSSAKDTWSRQPAR